MQMMKVYDSGVAYALEDVSNWSITSGSDGSKQMSFDVSPYADGYSHVEEDAAIEYDGTMYRIKTINERTNAATVTAEIDTDDLREDMFLTFTTETQTLSATLSTALAGTDWTVSGADAITSRRSLELTDVTPLDIIKNCSYKTNYNVSFAFDNINRVITVQAPSATANNVFFSDQLNLKALTYKGSSQSLITRLYAYGKDGLSFADINDGKPYIDNQTYAGRVISQVWRDDRFTDKQSLLAAAWEKLNELALPERSYVCDVLDIEQLNEIYYRNFKIRLGSIIILVDRRRNKRFEYYVIGMRTYPNEPQNNQFTLSKNPPKL